MVSISLRSGNWKPPQNPPCSIHQSLFLLATKPLVFFLYFMKYSSRFPQVNHILANPLEAGVPTQRWSKAISDQNRLSISCVGHLSGLFVAKSGGLSWTLTLEMRIKSSSHLVHPRFHTTASVHRLDRGQLGLNAPGLRRHIHKCQQQRSVVCGDCCSVCGYGL